MKTSWLGQAEPDIARMVLTRRQTPEKLFEAEGRLPMLVLSGTKDKQVRGDVVVKEMSPHFKDMKVVMIRRCGTRSRTK